MTTEDLVRAVDAVLAGGRDAAVRREQTEFDDARAGTAGVVLFGAGGIGRKAVAGLRSVGIEPLAFADNSPNLWGQTVDGVPVRSVPDAAAAFAGSALFVVTTWRGEDCRMAELIRDLRVAGCERVISFGPLFWKCADALLPHYLLELPHKVFDAAERVRAGCHLWADDKSRSHYLAQVRWRAELNFDGLPAPVGGTMYFPEDIVRLSGEEWFIDGGAFDGDTLAAFRQLTGGRFGRYDAFEPDPANFRKLTAAIAALPPGEREKVTARPLALGAEPGVLRFHASGTHASAAVGSAAVGTVETEVEVVTLDDALAGAEPTFIKLDIEGAEPAALAGAAGTIRRCRPTLAVCVYHAQDHVWSIPLSIRAVAPDYRLYLRPHLFAGWDLVCYAVPPERAVGPAGPGVSA